MSIKKSLSPMENLEKFDKTVKSFVDEAKKNGKELIVSECCWGSLDDNNFVYENFSAHLQMTVI